MLLLEEPDSNCRAQILFQIDSAASCNTLLSCHFSSIPWAKILPSKTVLPPYDIPPTRLIGQLTLQASKGQFTSNLTLQVIYTDQPALLSTEASKALDHRRLNLTTIRNQQLGPFHHPRILQCECGLHKGLELWNSFPRTEPHSFKVWASSAHPSISSWIHMSNPFMFPFTVNPFQSWMQSKRPWMRIKPLASW